MIGADLALDFFPDHGILTGHFELERNAHPTFTWRVPRHRADLPPQFALPSRAIQSHAEGANARYMSLWSEYESRVSDSLLAQGCAPLEVGEKGRAHTAEVVVQTSPIVPPAKGRQGEIQPGWHAHSVRHAHWCRQLRRLQALQQALKASTTTATAVEHRASVWHAIRAAPGFGGGFEGWYSAQ